MSLENQEKNIGFIYFMTERDLFGYPCGPYVKIGLVKGNDDGRSSFDRRKEHQTGNPREIIIEAEVKTYAQVSTLEALVHQRLAKNRIHGEWFNYGEDGIHPYVELTKEINRDLESELENDLRINNYSEIQDNGEEIKPSSDAEDIYNEFLKVKAEFLKIKGEKDLAVLKLRSFNKEFCRDIDGICSYEKIKPSEKLESVIFATHSDQALAILDTPSTAETEILGAIKYQRNDALLHFDDSILPGRKKAWSSWNYLLDEDQDGAVALTYNMNILQSLNSSRTFCVSLNSGDLVDRAKVIKELSYEHPLYTISTIEAQNRKHEISGINNRGVHTYFWFR